MKKKPKLLGEWCKAVFSYNTKITSKSCKKGGGGGGRKRGSVVDGRRGGGDNGTLGGTRFPPPFVKKGVFPKELKMET